jgi:transposase
MIWKRPTSTAPIAIRSCVSERYEYIPAQILVAEDACQKYVLLHGQDSDEAAAPLKRSKAGASLLAHVITNKVADHLPRRRRRGPEQLDIHGQ